MKLAVIKCETASQKILEHYGDYDELIYSFLEQSNSNFDVETFDCKKIIFPILQTFSKRKKTLYQLS